jgi:hypothetical protein
MENIENENVEYVEIKCDYSINLDIESKYINSMEELAELLQLKERKEVIDKMIKEDPEAVLLQEYEGKFKDMLMKYINEFLVPDIKLAYKKECLHLMNKDIWSEAVNIKLFCEWLEDNSSFELQINDKINAEKLIEGHKNILTAIGKL